MEEKFELTEQNRKILINYFLKKDKVLGLDKRSTNDPNLQNSGSKDDPEKSWWYDGEIFNQQAHVIMRILSNKNLRVPNKGFRLWYTLAFTNNEALLEKIVNKEFRTNLSKYDDKLEIMNTLKNHDTSTKQSSTRIDDLLDCVELYFSKPSNFTTTDNKLDYLNFNEPILNNLYNWYLNALTNPVEINTYCEYFEEIICNMQQLLIKYFDNTVYKYNLICTLCKTNEVLNELKLKLLEDGDQTKDCLETENELMKTILKAIKLTPTIKI